MDLNQYVGKMDANEPSFGYPLPNLFDDTLDSQKDKEFYNDFIIDKIKSLSPIRS